MRYTIESVKVILELNNETYTGNIPASELPEQFLGMSYEAQTAWIQRAYERKSFYWVGTPLSLPRKQAKQT